METRVDNQADKHAECLTHTMINILYVAGDLNSLAKMVMSHQPDLERHTNILDKCIAILLVARRSVPFAGFGKKVPTENRIHTYDIDASAAHGDGSLGSVASP